MRAHSRNSSAWRVRGDGVAMAICRTGSPAFGLMDTSLEHRAEKRKPVFASIRRPPCRACALRLRTVAGDAPTRSRSGAANGKSTRTRRRAPAAPAESSRSRGSAGSREYRHDGQQDADGHSQCARARHGEFAPEHRDLACRRDLVVASVVISKFLGLLCNSRTFRRATTPPAPPVTPVDCYILAYPRPIARNGLGKSTTKMLKCLFAKRNGVCYRQPHLHMRASVPR